MADIADPPIADVSRSETLDASFYRLQTELAEAAISSLKLAMQNAVTTQQQLNQLGVAALTEALSGRLANANAAKGEASATEPKDASADGKGVAEVVRASVAEASRGALGPELMLAWSRAFAVGLTLIDAATSQHMRDIIGSVLMAQVHTSGPIGVADAVLLKDVLTGNAVAETIADLNAALGATASRS